MSLTEYPQDAPAPKKSHRRLVGAIVGAVVLVGVLTAGAFVVPSMVATAQHNAVVAAEVKAQADVPAAPAGEATTADDQTALANSDAAGAQAITDEQAAEAAQAAALAAQQAAAAQAAKAKPADGIGSGNAPAGTVIPLHLDTDPNSGSYGQMIIENPDQFCASNGGTTRSDGVAVCS